MKAIYLLLLIIVAGTVLLYPQAAPRKLSAIDKKIQTAPAKIQKHYATLDSLIDLGQRRWVNETWTDSEVKRYASLLYDVYEYDPILRKRQQFDPVLVKQYEGKGWLIDDRTIFREIVKRLPHYEAHFINTSYWIIIKIDSVITQPMENVPGEDFHFTENKVLGTVEKVWKGQQFKPGDKLECYYLKEWGNPGIEVGKEFVFGLSVVIMDAANYKYKLAIGGPYVINENAFPIQGGIVFDKTNLFGLGNKVDFKTLDNFFKNEIAKIKSWKWSADK